MKKERKQQDYREFLPSALELEKTPVNIASRILLWIILFIVTTTVAWAAIGKMDIVTVAQGKVIPDGKTKPVQSMVKASVDQVHVKENERVTRGQLLVSLDAEDQQAELIRLQQHFEQLSADENRYGKLLELLQSRDKALPRSDDYLLLADWHVYQEKQAEIDVAIEKLEFEKKRTRLESDKYQSILPILENKEKNLKKLADKNLTSNQQYLDQKQLRLQTLHDLKAAKVRTSEIQSAIESLHQKKTLLVQQTLQTYAQKHKTSSENRQSIEQELVKQKQLMKSYQLKSPINGRVHQLSVNGSGTVVTPAQQLMMIVPDDLQLEVEAFVKNSDIGFVQSSQSVQIKVDAYPFTRYGLLDGKLTEVGSDAIQDENYGLVYRVMVEPAKNHLDHQGRKLALAPGMTVSVEVITGQRRLIDYFLEPLQRYSSESIRER